MNGYRTLYGLRSFYGTLFLLAFMKSLISSVVGYIPEEM
jgi:hypothetical protein